MKSFNMSRFGLLLRTDYMSQLKPQIRTFLQYYLGMTAVFCMNYYRISNYGTPDVTHTEEQAVATASIVFMVFFYYNLACTFSRLATKQQRIAHFMQPATPLEKYLAALLRTIICAIVYGIVAFVLADLTRMVVMPIFGHAYGSVVPAAIERIDIMWQGTKMLGAIGTAHGVSGWWMVLFPVVGTFFTGAFYVLMSTLFRKRPFLYGCLIQLGVFILFVMIMDQSFIHISFSRENDAWIIIVIDSLLLLLGVAELWLSYRVYRRLQVIPRKLFR